MVTVALCHSNCGCQRFKLVGLTFLLNQGLVLCYMENKTLGGEKMASSFKKGCFITMFFLVSKGVRQNSYHELNVCVCKQNMYFIPAL